MKTKSAPGFQRLAPITISSTAAILFGLLFSALPPPASAGSAPAILNCRSLARTGGVTTLAGEIPGDYEVFDLKIRKGTQEYALKSLNKLDRDIDPEERVKLEEEGVIAKDRVITVVEDFPRGVFTVALRGAGDYDLRLYALPQTVKARIGPNSKKATFEAMLLEGGSPGAPHRGATRMRCTYDHSI